MAEVETKETPGEALTRLIRERGLRVGFVREQVLRINQPATMTRKMSGQTALTALERKALAEFFDVPESTFEPTVAE